MPFHRKVKKFGKSVHSRLEIFLSATTQSLISSPNVSASSSLIASAGPVDTESKTNPRTTIQADPANIGVLNLPNPPTHSLTGASEVVSSLPHTGGSSSERAISPHTPMVSSNTGISATITPNRSTSQDSWGSLKAFLRVVNQTAGVFGPLKAVVDELVGCIGIYEVSVLNSSGVYALD